MILAAPPLTIARRTPSHFDPHDVSIETVLRAAASATRLPPEGKWPGYFRRIVDNVIRDLHGARSALVDRRKRPAAIDDPPGGQLSWEELARRCLLFLHGQARELFIWKYLEELPDNECARRRGCSLKALWAAKARLLKRLRRRLRFGLLLLLPALAS